jgi:hypothetical protein
MGKTKKQGGEEERRRGLTLAKIILHHNKNFRGACSERKRNDKNMTRSAAATVLL